MTNTATRWRNRTATLRKRDGDDCWLVSTGECLCPAGPLIDFGLPRTHRWAPSHDHVVPRAVGGANTVGNLRLAHRHCNSVRIVPDLPRRERQDKYGLPRAKLAVGVFRTAQGYEARDYHLGRPPRVVGSGDTIEAAWSAYKKTERPRRWVRAVTWAHNLKRQQDRPRPAGRTAYHAGA